MLNARFAHLQPLLLFAEQNHPGDASGEPHCVDRYSVLRLEKHTAIPSHPPHSDIFSITQMEDKPFHGRPTGPFHGYFSPKRDGAAMEQPGPWLK